MDAKPFPDVKSYLDANQYLQDVYTFKKNQAEKFSYDIWAHGMGLSSKSYLRFAVLGERKISADLTRKISDFLQLEEANREYFSLLVLYTQSSEPEQKKFLGRKMTVILREFVVATEITPSPAVLDNPLCVVLRNLLSFSDVPRTSEFLQKVLGLSSQHLSEMLDTLTREGLIAAHGDSWQANHQVVRVSEKPQKETQLYHKLTLLRAIEAQAQDPNERNFRSVGLALSKEEYQIYLQELNAFVKSLFAKFDGEQLINRRLYQINFNLFPWTQTILMENLAEVSSERA